MLDAHISGLSRKEKAKIYEMLNVTMSTILRPEDTEDLKNETNCHNVLLKVTFRSIAKVVSALAGLKSKEYLGVNNQEILMKGSVSELIFLRSIPFIDDDTKSWTFRQNPVS